MNNEKKKDNKCCATCFQIPEWKCGSQYILYTLASNQISNILVSTDIFIEMIHFGPCKLQHICISFVHNKFKYLVYIFPVLAWRCRLWPLCIPHPYLPALQTWRGSFSTPSATTILWKNNKYKSCTEKSADIYNVLYVFNLIKTHIYPNKCALLFW